MDKCPMCGFVDPSTNKNKPQTNHMNNYVVDNLSKEGEQVGTKVLNSNERYIELKGILHRRSDLPFGAPKVAEKKVIPQAAPSDVKAPTGKPIATTEVLPIKEIGK